MGHGLRLLRAGDGAVPERLPPAIPLRRLLRLPAPQGAGDPQPHVGHGVHLPAAALAHPRGRHLLSAPPPPPPPPPPKDLFAVEGLQREGLGTFFFHPPP